MTTDIAELVDSVRPMIQSIARDVYTLTHTEFDDLIADGLLGAVKAARGFDPDRGWQFATYARHRIRGEMLDGARRMDYLARGERQRVSSDIAAARAAGEEYVNHLTAQPVSLDADVSVADDGDPLMLRDLLVDPDKGPEDIYADGEVFSQAFAVLFDRYRDVIIRVYWHDESLGDIADQWGVSPSRVSQIHSDAIRMMRVELLNRGLDVKRLVDSVRRERGKRFASRIDPLERLAFANRALAELWGVG